MIKFNISKIKQFLSAQRGSILLSVFIVCMIALIIAMLLTDIAIEQMRTTARNIHSSSAFGISQAGIEDALSTIQELEQAVAATQAAYDADPTPANLQILDDAKAALKKLYEDAITKGQNCGGAFDPTTTNGTKGCNWRLQQDSVIGRIKKDHAVTFDVEGIASNQIYAMWECPPAAGDMTTASAMVITFITKNGTEFFIPHGGKLAYKCDQAPSNIAYTKGNSGDVPIGTGGVRIHVNSTPAITVPGGVKYLRIRAVWSDVKHLRLITDVNDPTKSFIKNADGDNFPFRDVIISEGVDGVSRFTSLARVRDLQVPALFDFVLYTDGAIEK